MPFGRQQPSGFSTGSVLSSTIANAWDTNLGKCVDSTAADTVAGTWTFTAAGGVTGGVAAAVKSGVSGGIVLSAGSADWVTFSTARTRLVQVGGDIVAGVTDSLVPQGGGFAANWGMYSANAPKIPGVYGGFITTSANSATADVYGYYLPLASALHSGATLTQATIQMIGSGSHSALPLTMPAFGIYRYSISGGTGVQALASGNGYAVDPTTVLATYNSYHAWSITLDQNNVIDRTAYGYAAVIWDEGDTNAIAGNVYLGVLLTYGSIDNMQFP